MFMSSVFVCLFILLVLAGGAALDTGLFKAGGTDAGSGRQALSSIFSYGISAGIWSLIYSFHYLGW